MNQPLSPEALRTLMLRQLEGHTTPDEARQLSDALRESPEARRDYVALARQHSQLFELAEERKIVVLERPAAFAPQRGNGFSGVSARMAAMLFTGLLLGAVMAGVVFAYTIPARPEPKVIPVAVADAGFEDGAKLSLGEVPAGPGNWQGDICEVVGNTGAVKPHSGAAMLRFVSVSTVPAEQNPKPICSDLWQLVTLPPDHARTVKVRAWFNAETGTRQARFHLYAMAGAGDAATAPALWAARFGESSDILSSGRTMMLVDSDPATWEAAEVTLDVPAEARVLLIGIASYRLPNVRQPAQWLPAQFADDISVSIVETEAAK